MSAIRPGEYGWNILHLKWPYFQAVAHRETQPHHVRTGHAARRARRRGSPQPPPGCEAGPRARPPHSATPAPSPQNPRFQMGVGEGHKATSTHQRTAGGSPTLTKIKFQKHI